MRNSTIGNCCRTLSTTLLFNAPAKAVLFATLLLFNLGTKAQSPCTGTPVVKLDFVEDPGATITTLSIQRAGECCPMTPVEDESCVDIEVTLDTRTLAVNLNVTGAPAIGSLFYSVDCGPKAGIGTPICITNTSNGVEVHHISFCKPGGNDYAFVVSSITSPIFYDLNLQKGCKGTLQSDGVQANGTTWTSTFPGAPGEYNNLLSCTDCTNPVFTPNGSTPSVVKYQACGLPSAAGICGVGSNPVCDEVVVTISETPWSDVADQAICEPATSVNLGAAGTGNSWGLGSGNPASASINSSTGAVSGMTANGTYRFVLKSNDNLCTDTVLVIRGDKPDAGDDQIVCLPTTTAELGVAGQGNSWSANAGNPAAASVDASTGAVSGLTVAGNYTFKLSAGDCFDEVVITVGALVDANAGSNKTLTCSDTQVTLNGSSSTPNAEYSWSGPGIVGGTNSPDVSVSASGTYTLVVTDPATNCTADATVSVGENKAVPANVSAGSNKTLTCTVSEVELNASSSTGGATFQWSGPGIVGPGNTADVNVTATGNYTVVATNPANGCTAEASVSVGKDENTPDVNAGSNKTLTCVVNEVTLDGSSSTPNAQYLWSGPGIVGSAISDDVDVSASGTYTLKVTDPSNGCTANASASVIEDRDAPNINAGGNRNITCADVTITLDGSSSTQGVSYQWSASNGGHIVSQGSGDAIVDEPGTYTLKVTNPSNGCTVSSSVIVTESGLTPVCDLDLPLYMPLDSTDGNKLHSGSSDYSTITWTLTSTDPDWVITSGQGTADIEYSTGAPGTYGIFKVVVSSQSGECKDSCQIQLFAASGEGFCTMSQGFYGNSGGKYCDGREKPQLHIDLLTNGPLVVGVPGIRSLTFTADDADCMIQRMPGGGPPSILPPTNANQLPADMTFTGSCATTPFTVPTKNGRFRNVFLAQTITTGMNLRLSPGLASLRITGPYIITAEQDGGGCIDESKGIIPGTETYHSISQAVLNYLGPNNTVLDIFNLANQVLAGQTPGGFGPSDVMGAVSVWTDAFHGCRRLVGFSDVQPQVYKAGDEQQYDMDMEGIYDEELNMNAAVNVYPNPFGNSTNVEYMMTKTAPLKVDVLDATGRVVSVLFNGTAEQNLLYSTQFNSGGLSDGMYIVRFVSDNVSVQKRIILQR